MAYDLTVSSYFFFTLRQHCRKDAPSHSAALVRDMLCGFRTRVRLLCTCHYLFAVYRIPHIIIYYKNCSVDTYLFFTVSLFHCVVITSQMSFPFIHRRNEFDESIILLPHAHRPHNNIFINKQVSSKPNDYTVERRCGIRGCVSANW